MRANGPLGDVYSRKFLATTIPIVLDCLVLERHRQGVCVAKSPDMPQRPIQLLDATLSKSYFPLSRQSF
jgi:hypothetical protein